MPCGRRRCENRGVLAEQPERRIEDEAIDLVIVLARIHAGDRGSPRPAHDVDLGDAVRLQNVIDRGAEIARGESPVVTIGLFSEAGLLISGGRVEPP